MTRPPKVTPKTTKENDVKIDADIDPYDFEVIMVDKVPTFEAPVPDNPLNKRFAKIASAAEAQPGTPARMFLPRSFFDATRADQTKELAPQDIKGSVKRRFGLWKKDKRLTITAHYFKGDESAAPFPGQEGLAIWVETVPPAA